MASKRKSEVQDEFIIDVSKRKLVERVSDKIERMHDVHISFDKVVENGRKQWLILEGESGDRRNAKEYIVAVCQPEERQHVNYPQLSPDCLDDRMLEQFEKQTNAAINKINGSEFEIYGTELNVTLALSMIEELIGTSQSNPQIVIDDEDEVDGFDKAIEISPEPSRAASRLTTTLQRALSENSDGGCSVDDYKLESVRRVIVHCLNEKFSDDEIDEDKLFNDGTNGSVGETQAGSQASSLIEIDGEAGSSSSLDNISTTAVCSITEKMTHTNISKPELSPLVIKQHEYLSKLGKSIGYKDGEIEEALLFVDEKTKPSDFLEFLATVKQKENPSASGAEQMNVDGDVKVVSLKDLPPPQPDGSSPFRRDLPDAYKSMLMRDFAQEDDNCSKEELLRRNKQRQMALKSKFQQENTGGAQQSPSGQSQQQKNKRSQSGPREKKVRKKNEPEIDQETSANKKGKQRNKENRGAASSGVEGDSDKGPSSSSRVAGYEEDEDQTCVMQIWDRGSDVCPTQPHLPNGPNQWSKATQQDNRNPQFCDRWSADHPGVPSNFIQNQQQKNQTEQLRRRPPPPLLSVPTSHSGPIARANPEKKAAVKPDDLRFIVIDGSNVAMTHGNGKVFSCKGIRICVDFFMKRGHKNIVVFVPQWRTCRPGDSNQILDQDILHQLKEEEILVLTPSRRIRGKMVASYDDRFVLELAEREEAIIVSNDQYRDLMREKASWKKIIEERLLMFSFVKDHFMPPEDPLGAQGPTLDEFLLKSTDTVMDFNRQLGPADYSRPVQWNGPQMPGPGQYRPQNFQQQMQGQRPGQFRPQNYQQQNFHLQGQGHGQGYGYNFPLPGQGQGHGQGRNYRPQGQNFQQFPGAAPQYNQGTYAQRVQRFPYNNRADGSSENFQQEDQGGRKGHGKRKNEQSRTLPERPEAVTQELYKELRTIFPDVEQEEKVRTVLDNHACETDLAKLTNYCMSVLFE